MNAAVFIDSANLWHCMQKLGWFIDYAKFKEFIHKEFYMYDNIRFYYFTCVKPEESSTIHNLLRWLKMNGYTVIEKPIKRIVDTRHNFVKDKGNVDMEMAIKALNLAHKGLIQHAFFMTGDGDFKVLVEELQNCMVEVTCFSSRMTDPPMIADELRTQVDKFIELNDIKHLIRNTT